MCKDSIVGGSHKISAKNIGHHPAGMQRRFNNLNHRHTIRDALLRILNTDPLSHRELVFGKIGRRRCTFAMLSPSSSRWPRRVGPPGVQSKEPVVRIIAYSIALLLLAVPVRSEWFERGNAAYMTPDAKWRYAAINVEEDSIEVYTRRDRVLVAKFATGQVERGMNERRRSKEAVGFGLGWGISWGLTVGLTSLVDDELSVREFRGEAVAGLAAIGVAIPAVTALTKAKHPYIEIKDGTRSIRLRVGKAERGRFDNAVNRFASQIATR